MNQPVYLKPWLAGHAWGARLTLFVILLSAIVQFAAFALSQNYVIAYLGAQPEDVTFSIQISYAGILAALPIQVRLLRYFETKYLLVSMMLFGILLSVACIYTTDIIYFFIIRFLQGVVICAVAGSVLTLLPGFLKPEHRQALNSTIFYGTILSSSVLIGVLASQVSLNSDLTNIYRYFIFFQAITILLVLIGFAGRSGMRPYPLYQIDWAAAVFFTAGAGGLAYLMVYGSKYYWFTDSRIVTAAMISASGIVLFIYRNLTVKRPLLDFSVFRSPKFWIGLVLLALYYGMKESINIVFGYTASVLQWSTPQVVELGLWNIAGLIIFMAISAAILVRKRDAIRGFLVVGFGMSLVYHLWMYFIFTPDLSFNDLILPLFFQGAASGVLFVPIMMFILTSVPPTTGITGLAIAACTRFTSLLNAGAGFYNLQLYYNQLYRESFLNHLTSVDNPTADRLNGFKQLFLAKGYTADQATALANVSLSKVLGMQGQLLSNRATFLFIAAITGVLLVLSVFAYLYKVTTSKPQLIPA